MDARELRGLQIAATMPIKRNTHGWLVPSQSTNGTYRVSPTSPDFPRADRVGGYQCTCPDFELRGQPCKHILAVEYTIKREFTPEGEVVTQEVRVTYTQDWAAYNRAQCEEKDRLCQCWRTFAPPSPNRPRLRVGPGCP